jgi:hypothetical protein
MDDDDLFNLIDFLWSEIALIKEVYVINCARSEHAAAWTRYEQWVETK